MLSSNVIISHYHLVFSSQCYYPNVIINRVIISCYHLMLSSHVIISCYHPNVIILCYHPSCYHLMLSSHVIIPMLSSQCYHLVLSSHIIIPCYHSILSFSITPMITSNNIIPTKTSLVSSHVSCII
jgi:hypothetical protein